MADLSNIQCSKNSNGWLHCWHAYGAVSGEIGPKGSVTRGQHICCWYGTSESYEHKSIAAPPLPHGKFNPVLPRQPGVIGG